MDIQFTSDDGTVEPGHVMYDWSQLFINAGEQMGRTFKIARESKKLIEAAGFVDVVERKYKVPVGGWMEDVKWKELGKWNLLYLTEGLEGMALYILKNVLRVSHPSLILPHVLCPRRGLLLSSKMRRGGQDDMLMNSSGITPRFRHLQGRCAQLCWTRKTTVTTRCECLSRLNPPCRPSSVY